MKLSVLALTVYALGSLTAHAFEMPTIEPGLEIIYQGEAKCDGRVIGKIKSIDNITEVMADGSFISESRDYYEGSLYANGLGNQWESTTTAESRLKHEQLLLDDNCQKEGGELVKINVSKEIVTTCKLVVEVEKVTVRSYFAGSSLPIRQHFITLQTNDSYCSSFSTQLDKVN